MQKKQEMDDKELKEVATWVSEVVGAAAQAETKKGEGGQSKAMAAALKLNAILKKRSPHSWSEATLPHQCSSLIGGVSGRIPNQQLKNWILLSVSAMGKSEYGSMTELDSHANMIVVGSQALVIQRTGQSAHVNAFSDEVQGMSEVPIVDAAVAYDCPTTGKTYLLIVRNTLHIPSMVHNLVPPFILQEVGIAVNNTPRIHVKEVTLETHSIMDRESGLRIPLQLDGIFSYFPTRALNKDEMEDPGQYETVFLSPDAETWDPYDKSYAINDNGYLNNREELFYTMPAKDHELIAEADVNAIDVDVDKTQSHLTKEVNTAINAVIASSAVVSCMPTPQDDMMSEDVWNSRQTQYVPK